MISATFRPNPNLVGQLKGSAQMERALSLKAHEVAEFAQQIAEAAGHHYTTVVQVDLGKAEIRGRTVHAEGVHSIAGWLEWGADGPRHIPALAPLRNAALRAGLNLGSSR